MNPTTRLADRPQAVAGSPLSGPQPSVGMEDLVTDDDRLTLPTELTSAPCDDPRPNVGVSPPSAEAACPDWEHLGG